jgi:hypothetical protein
MKIVTEVILEYLGSNRRLVVPALGAFMVKDTGNLVFSDLLRNDDGVLSSLLRDRGMNDMEAAVMIDRFVFEVRHELEQYGYCRMGELGTLRLEPDTNVLRLYPPVKSEVELPVVDAPYIPTPIVEPISEVAEAMPDVEPAQSEEVAEVAEDNAAKQPVAVAEELPVAETPIEQPKEESAQPEKIAQPEEVKVPPKSEMPRPKRAKRRPKFDLVMVVAIAVIVAAVALIVLGLYNANISDKANDAADNAAMENARVITDNNNG